MEVKFRSPKIGKRERFDRALGGPKAAIFTRLEGQRECVAVVRDATDRGYHWVWLSGNGDGAFTDGIARTQESIVDTLVQGEWIHQPNAEIRVETTA